MEKALQAGVKEIAVFTAASELFHQRNINCSIKESIDRFKPVLKLAKENHIKVRGYISCVLGCPYQGEILPTQVVNVAQQLLELGVDEISLGDTIGVDEISLGDTIGVGTPKQTQMVLDKILKVLSREQLAMHFHDTYGQAMANIYTSLNNGVHRFDMSLRKRSQW